MFSIVSSFITPYKLYFYSALLIGVLSFGAWEFHVIKRDAVNAYKATVVKEDINRVYKSTQADEAAKRCSADPACSMSSDGFRRD